MGKLLRTLILSAPLVVLAACSHPVYLKSFEASAPAQAGLNGRTVYLEPIVDQRDPQKQEWKESQPREDPPGFKFKELGAHKGTWEAERNQLQSQISEDKWHKLGHQRNGFGIPIKDVKSVNAPAEWLTEAVKIELAAQGATVVQSADAADLVIRGTIKHLFIDLYMATWAHGVVDFELTAKGNAPKVVRIHTVGGRTAWSGSSEESFAVFREMEQKLNFYLMQEAAATVATAAAPAEPPPAAAPPPVATEPAPAEPAPAQ